MQIAQRLTGKPPEKKEKTMAQLQARIRKLVSRLQIRDKSLTRDWIGRRQKQGIDKFDEVWEGVYVVPPLATNPHQGQAGSFVFILHEVIVLPGRGRVYPGANVSDRRKNWEKNFRCPDVVVVLNGGRAVDCGTHWLGGPDFLVEIESPNDDTQDKIPFYGKIKVRELLIVQRDTRALQLLRHNGQELVEVKPSPSPLPLSLRERGEGGGWLQSEVVPLAFRRIKKKIPTLEIRRTDNIPGRWTV